jgi:hypothetical protein
MELKKQRSTDLYELGMRVFSCETCIDNGLLAFDIGTRHFSRHVQSLHIPAQASPNSASSVPSGWHPPKNGTRPTSESWHFFRPFGAAPSQNELEFIENTGGRGGGEFIIEQQEPGAQ